MDMRRMPIGPALVGVLAIGAFVVIIAGCGEDATEPKPDLRAMGGILITPEMPPGTPYQAGVVVTVDGEVVSDAVVKINDTTLQYMNDPAHPETAGYSGLISASEGQTITLSVAAAGETKSMRATVPGIVQIHNPARGFVYADADEISITWTPATNSLLTVVTCAGPTSTTPGMWMLSGDATTHTVPGSFTPVPGCRISVMGVNGSGDLPSSMDLRQWPGKNGFWVSSQDYLDVQIIG